MAYEEKIWRTPYCNEYEYGYEGKYGARGEKRAKRKKPTPEQIKKQNQRNKEKTVARILRANFEEGDLWCTLKYPKGTKKPIEEVAKDLTGFLGSMRYQYKKRAKPFKWIYRVEIGKHGGVHIHMVIGRIRGEPDTDKLIQSKWKHGRVNFQNLQGEETYGELAGYITKPPPEELEGQISLFHEQDQKKLSTYSCSRNLIRPKPERKRYSHWTMRKILEEGPKPTPGYYIDKNSIVAGINPYTGMSYYHYMEYKVRKEERGSPGGGG